jgi:Tfp pilus assembly protein PilF
LGARDLQIAAENFNRSIQTKPGFAPAYGCLAYTYSISAGDWNPFWKDLPTGKDNALKSLKLQDVAEAHLALAWHYALKEWRWKDATNEYEKALKLQPKSALCHFSHAEFLRVMGHVDDALIEWTNAMSIQPHPKFLAVRLPAYLVDAKRYEEALTAIEKASHEVPRTLMLYSERSALCALGRCDELIELERAIRNSNGDPEGQGLKAFKQELDKEGLKAYWRANKANGSAYDQACCYAQLEEKEQALKLLEGLRDRQDVLLTFRVMTDWRLDPLRSESRFKVILKKMNFPE